jgi:hypothetical protein
VDRTEAELVRPYEIPNFFLEVLPLAPSRALPNRITFTQAPLSFSVPLRRSERNEFEAGNKFNLRTPETRQIELNAVKACDFRLSKRTFILNTSKS